MKLIRLQLIMRRMSKHINGITKKVEEARENMCTTQNNLIKDIMNTKLIREVMKYTIEVLNWNEIEENELQQKAKVE